MQLQLRSNVFTCATAVPRGRFFHGRFGHKLSETNATEVNGRTWTTKHHVAAEPKANIGFSGESGGPGSEKAEAREFRSLKITAMP